MTTLETSRLILRPYGPGDVDDVAALYGDPDVTAYTKLGQRDRAQSAALLDDYMRDWQTLGFGMFALFLKPAGAYAGECGLFVLEPGGAALRYAIHKGHWGQGLTREALEPVLAWAFGEVGLTRIVSVVQVRNRASNRVMEKLGFRVERTDRDADADADVLIYALERES